MDDSGSSDSWNKLVITKTNDQNEWVSTIKTEHIDAAESAADTTGFCLDYDPFSDVKSQAIEAGHPSYQCIQSLESPDPGDFLLERKRQREEPGHRAERLAKMSAYAAQRLANETPEQRAVRLKRMSEYAAKRLANETSEQRAKRLSRMSAYAAKRLARESPEQRQDRLTRMSAYAAKRHAMKKMNTPNAGKRKSRSDSSLETPQHT